MKFFASCGKGLEYLLVDELLALGCTRATAALAGANVEGSPIEAQRAVLWSRVASRVLWPIVEFDCPDEHALYAGVAAVPWPEHLAGGHTVAVDAHVSGEAITHARYAAQRVKDGVVDVMRAQTGARPDVDIEAPDLRLNLVVRKGRAIVSIDLGGGPLHRRGWRQLQGEAPLKENLAAAVLLRGGWPQLYAEGGALLDPMCGSGTFLIEAAQMSLNIAPGIGRHFAFEKLHTFNEEKWQTMRAEAITAQKPVTALPVFGSDLYGDELKAARLNLENAGLLGAVTLKQANVREISAPADHGVMVTNLPYGERMGELDEMRMLYPQLGDALKQKFKGWNAYLLTADLAMPKSIRLSVSRRIPLFNGALECRLFEYKVVAGSNRK